MRDSFALSFFQLASLVLVALGAAGVVSTRNPTNQSIAMSFYGLVLALMFFVYQAPDVSLSQLVVGALAMPLMILLTLSKAAARDLEKARRGKQP